MDVLPIGSITLFTNVHPRQQYLFDAALNEQVSKTLVALVQDELVKFFPDASVVVIGYETKTGCIITPILLGVVLAKTTVVAGGTAVAASTAAAAGAGVGLGAGAYKLLTDYDKIKKNIKEMVKDLNTVWLKIKRWRRKPQTEKAHTIEHTDADLETAIEVYRETPDELKKYAGGSANGYIVYSGWETTTTYNKVCPMRDDIQKEIKEPISEKDIQKIEIAKSVNL